MMPTVVVHPRAVERARRGHPWIYRSDVVEVGARAGDLVRVLGPNGRAVGEALYSDRSQIALRLLVRGERHADRDWLRERLQAAIALRRGLGIEATAYRLVHAEGDLLPSLVVDRYGDVLVVQALSQGMDRRLGEVVELLAEELAPAGILARNDARVRALEGLERKVEVLRGEVPPRLVVRDRDVEYEVDLRQGQKTGLFLDQRENRWAAARYAHGRLLDCFSYDGGFALQLARRCDEALAVDISPEAAARIERNAARNAIGNLLVHVANAFDFLREAERRGERFDTIVLDPPAFAKTRAALGKALGGYKEINLRALKLLAPGGVLVTCSCSYHVSEAQLLEVVRAAAVDAHAALSLVEKRVQSPDHPVLLGVPETDYLKCLILRKL
ncbi:MAG: class I SAM-dependent rRNA methyltransferase [Deltaproteobacteria bacterium]|nr:class I SAM-dependent rRNA methyltransferase [Deltaproteobacteria bacterium]